MPRHGGDESMDLSDDDSISITSTVASETLEEYVVEAIIAERMHDSGMQYLVKWVGYPDERCTWEPESSFQSEDTLLDWQAQKMRYSRGLETPCNVNALLDKVEEWISSTAERKSRRRAKRLRLGLSVSPLESDVEDECDDYDNSEPVVQPSNSGGRAPTAIMVELHKVDQSVGKFNTASQTPTASSTKNSFDYIGGGQRTAKSAMPTLGRESDGKSIRDVDRKEALPKLVSKLRVSIPSSSMIASPRVSRRTSETGQNAAQLDLSPQLMRSTISDKSGSPNARRASLSEQRPPSASAGLNTSIGLSNSKSEKEFPVVKKTQMGRSGRGPARLNASNRSSSSASLKKNDVSGAAILGNWNRVVKRRKAQVLQPDLSRAGGKPVEMFGKLSTLRRFEKAGRNEPAPDINSLTFVDLKHGRVTKRPTLVSPKLTIPPKTPFELIQEGLEETPTDKMDAEPFATNNATVGVQDPTLDVAASNAPEAETTVSTSPLDERGGKSRDPRVQSRMSFQSYKEKSVPSSLVSANERHTTSPRNPLAEGSIMNTSRQQLTQNSMTTVPMEIDSEQAQDNNALVASVLQPSQTPRQIPWVDVASDLRHLAAPIPLSKTQHDFISSKEASDVLGTLLIGPECRNLGGVRFRGLETPAKHLFLSIKVPPRQMNVWCQHICSAGEYQAYYHLGPSDYFGTGYTGFIVPYFQTAGAVTQMAETLKLQASCAVFTTTRFSLLIYPSNAVWETWNFLEHGLPMVPEGTTLRFVIRKPLAHMAEPVINIAAQTIRDAEKNTSMLLRNTLGIEYDRLVKQPDPVLTAKSKSFFLFFVNKEHEYRIMYRFLEEHGADIYSWDTEGAWDYFCSKVDVGVILIEGSFWELNLIPNLSRVLRKAVNVFNITFYKDIHAPHPHINRLFPYGWVFLITDSFILLQPHEAARFLRWFRLQTLPSKAAGTWKLCTRPFIRDFILTLADVKSEEDGHVFMQIYESLWYILPQELMEDDEFETPRDEAPVRCMNEGVLQFDLKVGTDMHLNGEAIAKNDSILVEWFAGWALTESEKFRRFNVISGASEGQREAERKEWNEKWSHIDILSPKTLLEQHKIPEWEAKEAEERTRKGKEETAKGKERAK